MLADVADGSITSFSAYSADVGFVPILLQKSVEDCREQ
jgi:hypothetical protein